MRDPEREREIREAIPNTVGDQTFHDMYSQGKAGNVVYSSKSYKKTKVNNELIPPESIAYAKAQHTLLLCALDLHCFPKMYLPACINSFITLVC